MTGTEYLESLDDGREVYIYGERVARVTEHPAFRNTARMIARLYDAMHDPARRDKLMRPTDTGNGGMTHAFFKAPKTPEDLLAGRDAIAEWARFAEQCMVEYDLHGWTVPDLRDPGAFSYHATRLRD
jgi:4-hydroxyphenylacetate 3-monooxygenase